MSPAPTEVEMVATATADGLVTAPSGAAVPAVPAPRPAVEVVGVSRHRLEDMAGGWFVGAFAPVALACPGAEVALKHVLAGTTEASHEHRISSEATLVVSGSVRLCGRVLGPGDILVIPPRTATAFEALEDSTIVVVKTPSVPGDKHLVPPAPHTW